MMKIYPVRPEFVEAGVLLAQPEPSTSFTPAQRSVV
ncbi:hypothetical protein HNQ99_000253 [Rhizorhapis suberifaciens]|uniref:Uncharacterized protein n=1 Tax=Rhizorhapis suberifaciens TaxID=13656 RepID=A0A840HQ37_9SPHN|nr:hypothetical protein [Rhizorhapis suberifaciens]